jgi:hypothetical protein
MIKGNDIGPTIAEKKLFWDPIANVCYWINS